MGRREQMMSHNAQAAAGTSTAGDPTRGRWLIVGAALLLQLSLGAVYAWSIFSKALQAAPPFELSKVEAALPFQVAIGMIFLGTYTGGRIQDRKDPASWRWPGASSTPWEWWSHRLRGAQMSSGYWCSATE